ncbi:hypothetical protein [Costertonia aggregata]|uniref:DUF309 domain-containing protein n=1 Tax=Costertonia aggregata TaxID=343403 RepID=A0A7H9AJY5_9FLAO|nr:hypothetical protein [Costertonia aggregata]QLG43856.1 hypothetical protein HYG79_00310 [Costertonia aggregata]
MKTLNDDSEFYEALQKQFPPAEWPLSLQALWYAANKNWKASHEIAQDLNTVIGSWIHAHLHRVEGDAYNAGYWYSRAKRPFAKNDFDEELHEILNYAIQVSY